MVNTNLLTKPEEFHAWQEYYQRADLTVFHYLNFALGLSPDYPFERARPDEDTGQLRQLSDFPGLLNRFWETADLESIWSAIKSEYVSEIRRYDRECVQKAV